MRSVTHSFGAVDHHNGYSCTLHRSPLVKVLSPTDLPQAHGSTTCAKTLPFSRVETAANLSQTRARGRLFCPIWTALGTGLGSFCDGLTLTRQIQIGTLR